MRSGRQWLCDTEHRGRRWERLAPFGRGGRGETPLLGDVDGEGRADLCVIRNGRFLCDTDHDGGEPEVSISFDPGRGTPLLGDFDGDGRADPCAHDGRRFSCDTAHDGGAAEAVLRFGHKGDRPLLGNLDGV